MIYNTNVLQYRFICIHIHASGGDYFRKEYFLISPVEIFKFTQINLTVFTAVVRYRPFISFFKFT